MTTSIPPSLAPSLSSSLSPSPHKVNRSKVDALKDIVTGSPTVIKMVVHFTRSDSGGGTGVLKELLYPLVEEILSQDSGRSDMKTL